MGSGEPVFSLKLSRPLQAIPVPDAGHLKAQLTIPSLRQAPLSHLDCEIPPVLGVLHNLKFLTFEACTCRVDLGLLRQYLVGSICVCVRWCSFEEHITSPYQSGHQNSMIIACCILLVLKPIFSSL